jgi:hypothetical protein
MANVINFDNPNYIEHIISKNGVSRKDLAKHLRITEEEVNELIDGKKDMTVRQMGLFRTYFKVEVGEIYPELRSPLKDTKEIHEEIQKEIEAEAEKAKKDVSHFTTASSIDYSTITNNTYNSGTAALIVKFFSGWSSFSLDVINKKLIAIFIFLIGTLIIVTDQQFNNYVVRIVPNNLFMLFAVRWTAMAILVGLMLPLLIKSWFAYLLLFNGFGNLIFIVETMVKNEFGPTVSEAWFAILNTPASIFLCIIYSLYVTKVRARLEKNKEINLINEMDAIVKKHNKMEAAQKNKKRMYT